MVQLAFKQRMMKKKLIRLKQFNPKFNIIPISYSKNDLIELLDKHKINYNEKLINFIITIFDEDGVPDFFEEYFNKMIDVFEDGIMSLFKNIKSN